VPDRTVVVLGFLLAVGFLLAAGLSDLTTINRLVRLGVGIGSAVVATVFWRRSNTYR
jgi:hypothetical protein